MPGNRLRFFRRSRRIYGLFDLLFEGNLRNESYLAGPRIDKPTE
jgi:hypothetical protein